MSIVEAGPNTDSALAVRVASLEFHQLILTAGSVTLYPHLGSAPEGACDGYSQLRERVTARYAEQYREGSLRILIAHNHYQQKGGEDAVVANETVLLAGHGHRVDLHVVTNDAIRGVTSKISALRNCTYSVEARRSIAERLASARPDVVHVHNLFPLLTPSIYDACHDFGVPVVQTLHNYRIMCAGALLMRDGQPCMKCINGSPYWGALHACYRNSRIGSAAVAGMIDWHRRQGTWTTKVDAYIALSRFARDRFVEAGLPAERIHVKSNLVFEPPPSEPLVRRGALFVGRLSEEKGVRDLIAAWQGLEIPLTIAGDGPLESELRRSAPASVRFLGQIDKREVVAEMQRAAFLVLPSRCFENFPVTIAEAFSNGLPAIVSQLGALQEIVVAGKTGLCVEPGNPFSLRQAVERAYANPKSMREMGRAARAHFASYLAPEANYHALMAIYDAAIVSARTRSANDHTSAIAHREAVPRISS